MKPTSSFSHRKIATFLALGMLFPSILAGMFMVAAAYRQQHDEALVDARSAARMILNRTTAFHDFFNSEFRPNLLRTLENADSKDVPFDPLLLSSSYIQWRIDEIRHKDNPDDYQYKLAAINARNPLNEADGQERRYLEDLAAGNAPDFVEEVREIDGKPYFVYMGLQRILLESCLECHGVPEDAPDGLLSRYGRDRGFHRKVGMPVGVGVVKIDLTGVFARAADETLYQSMIMLAILCSLMLVLWWFVTRFVVQPLQVIENRFAAPDPVAALNAPVPERPYLMEIASLETSLASYAQQVRKQGERLERAVETRTEELSRLSQELIAKNDEMERFIYSVSHDLKSPLITIQGFTGLVEKGLPSESPVEIRDDLEQISRASTEMYTLIDSLLNLSRAGRRIGPAETFSIEEVVREALSLVSGPLEQGLVQCVISSDLPVVTADRLRIRQVIQNLLENSIKYMGEQPEPRIEVGAAECKGELCCFVRDNGRGIQVEYTEKVFGMFEKLDPAIEGSGVGLAMVRRIIELHGGSVWIESAGVGTGTTVWFKLPRQLDTGGNEGL